MIVIDKQTLKFSETEWDSLQNAKPWNKDPKYFKTCKISAIAALKMFIHGLKGMNNLTNLGWYREVMGIPLGFIRDNTFYIVDAYEVPCDATAVEVRETEDTWPYIGKYSDLNSDHLNNPYRMIGWYHSHPGYTPY